MGKHLDRKLWEPLRKFESQDYLARQYKKQHGRDLNRQRAQEIGSCFTQGREYFASAAAASEAVKPLLLYYGVTSLARGVTLLKDSRKCEESLTPGHGLVTVDWPKTLASGISNVLDLKIKATKGTFGEFVGAIGNAQSYAWLQGNTTGHFKNDFGEIHFLKSGSMISLADLLSRETDLIAEFEVANDGPGNTDLGLVLALENILRIYFMPVSGRDIDVAISAYRFPENARRAVGPDPRFRQISSTYVDIPAVGEDRKKVAPMANEQAQTIGWLIRPFPNGDNIIDIHKLFLESYILGMLSRYFPSKWMSLIRSEKGDIARSVILAAMDRIETKFPLEVRNHLPG